jgi:L-malate glycosyltransferase
MMPTPPTSDALTVLHVVAPGEVGGLESVVEALASGLHERGHRVFVAVTSEGDARHHPYAERLRAASVNAEVVAVGRRAYLRERASLGALMARLRPDVVHTHGYRSDLVGGSAARALDLPLATTVHGFTGGGWKNRLYERLQERAFRRFDAVVAVSRPLVGRLRAAGVPSGRIHLVPNAWGGRTAPVPRDAARARLGVSGPQPVLGWVGRLTREKGADVLLDALGSLRELPVTVSFVGDGPERPRLEAQAARLGVTERVRWHGRLPDAGALFPAFDGFILSSRTEGTPIVLFEALAARVPVVATAVGGVPDVVGASEAILVAANAPADLASGIRRLLSDPVAAALRADTAAERLSTTFAREPWLDSYESIYWALTPRTANPHR